MFNKQGKKGKEWAEVRAELVQEFLRNGITTCEIRLKGCWQRVDGFAHSLTRQWLGRWDSDEREVNIREVVAACNYCHDKIEKKPSMYKIVNMIREARNRKLSKWRGI